ncbi:MAG: PD-(D/E)XK nuclease family protein [Prevotella sp.]|nr:PD-(D/E)XK nuclease family protein [Prevotella sp.]MCM1075211.1 PD-(D/E)XK nuclease family protein [Ruminococcus sp.]
MIPFLQSVAIELTARFGGNIRDFIIVMPHKRGVTYMRKYFEQVISDRIGRLPGYGELPKIITISDHTAHISGLKPATRLQLLFSLYSVHHALYAPGEAFTAEDFDNFRSWGETVIADFNDVDMYCVDADALYKNLADINDIATDYLSEEQKKTIEKYFGVSNIGLEVERFWKHLHKQGEMQQHFLSLWEKLAPLYLACKQLLREKQISYPGMAFQEATRNIEDGKYKFKNTQRVVYVGFNALSTAERALFKAVQQQTAPDGNSLADFFWDTPGPALAKHSPVEAARFLRRNAADFPCSVKNMDKYADAQTFPERIEEIACPGNVAQAKVITQLLKGIIHGHGEPYIDPARVAVVLPDEGLLFPVFHSVPANVAEKVNLTMGYPLRHTSVASFTGILRLMYTKARKRQGCTTYYHKDVTSLLSHPLVRILLGHDIANLIHGYLLQSRLYFISVEDMLNALSAEQKSEYSEIINTLFAPLPNTDTPAETIRQICNLLTKIREKLMPETPTEAANASEASLETANIDHYLKEFEEFAALCAEYNLKMSPKTALFMACRVLANDTLSMQGEPLTGLQIMGMLETRALDFDYLIIPSMNERIFPRRLKARTFIPDSLRIGYGIATTRFQEEIYAYHFYRLLARAKEVYLLYDASQGGLKSGDPSRYLLQLRYLLANGHNIKKTSARFLLNAETVKDSLAIPKSKSVMEFLNKYLNPTSDKRLSASSLKEYLACPMKFYFSYIRKMKVDEQPDDFMGAIVIGNVLHESLDYIYKSVTDNNTHTSVITAEMIQAWKQGASIGEYENIQALAISMIRKNYMENAPADAPLPGDALITLEMLELQIQWCLDADLKLAPFEYVASELKLPAVYQFDENRQVNMTMIIDRLDRVNMPGGERRLRIVDYKTGSDEVSFDKVEKMFAPKDAPRAIFQLMLYAMLYSEQYCQEPGEEIALSIYKTRALPRMDFETFVKQKDKPVLSHLPYMPEFKQWLNEKLSELFDKDTPFAPPAGMPDLNPNHHAPCMYCPYAGLCTSK